MEVWRSRMLSTLLSRRDQTITEDVLRDLSPEFFMHVEWLPGGRFEEGEFIPDPIFEEAARHPEDEQLRRLCDPTVRGFIFNFIREYGGLECVNVGRISESLSKQRPLVRGRRGVYLAELQLQGDVDNRWSVSFGSRNGGFASGWMRASRCCRRCWRAKNTPITCLIAGWASCNSA